MSDNFEEVRLTDTIKNSLSKLLNRDLTALTLSSGTSFPSNVSEDMVGRLVNRTDLKCLYHLTSSNPVTWELVLDYSSPIMNAQEVANNYQPKNSNLTALSNITAAKDKLPYFVNSTTMNTLDLTEFSKELLQTSNAEDVRTELGLGSLATKSAVYNSDIQDRSITLVKLAFTPILQNDGFTTGDVKRTFETVVPSGWIRVTQNSFTVGPVGSGATYANANAETLFKLLWSNPKCSVLPNKGTSANSDWEGGARKIQIPDIFKVSTMGENVWVRL